MTPLQEALAYMLAINACVAFSAYQIGKWRERGAVIRFLDRMHSLYASGVRRGDHRRKP